MPALSGSAVSRAVIAVCSPIAMPCSLLVAAPGSSLSGLRGQFYRLLHRFRGPDLAEIGAVRDRATDRIDRRIADDQVEVGAVRAEGVVGGGTELVAGL